MTIIEPIAQNAQNLLKMYNNFKQVYNSIYFYLCSNMILAQWT